jgi:pimeloyl-ACP methyl ester carboxylesterase
MSSRKDRYVDVSGTKTHFIEAGQGETLMLVHGGGLFSCAEINWGFVIESLAKHFHVLAADQIGFGYTPIPHEDYSLKARGDHLIAFLETLNEKRVHIVGNSHGGWLATYISIRCPDLVRKLVIVNSGSVSSPLTIDSPGLEKEFPTMFDKSSYTTPPTLESVREALLENTFHKELVTPERVRKAFEIAVRNFETHRLRTDYTETSVEARNRNVSINGKHISEHVQQLKMPVLLIWGRHDEGVARLENGLRLLSRIPGAEMHIFDYAKHLPMVDQSKRFVSVVTDFLNG